MSLSLRRIALGVGILIGASTSLSPCSAQQTSLHASPSGVSSPVVFSSSRTGLDPETDSETLAATPPDSAPQPEAAEGSGVTRQRPAYTVTGSWLFHEFGAGAFVSPLGVGVGAATSITRSVNLRVAGNFFGYTAHGTDSGVTYKGDLSFRSIQASFDWFPWHKNFHLSPGVLFYNQNRITANGGVPAGDSFTVNGATYYSGAAQPVTLYGQVTFRRTSPMFTVGWGNWLPRRTGKHLNFPLEIGFAYTGDAPLVLNFTGVVCDTPQDVNCRQIDSDPTVQQNIDAQRKKYQNDLDYLRFYPIISGGVAYKF